MVTVMERSVTSAAQCGHRCERRCGRMQLQARAGIAIDAGAHQDTSITHNSLADHVLRSAA